MQFDILAKMEIWQIGDLNMIVRSTLRTREDTEFNIGDLNIAWNLILSQKNS